MLKRCGCDDVREQVISGGNVPEAMRFARLARARDEFYYRFRCAIGCLGLFVCVACFFLARRIEPCTESVCTCLMHSPAQGWTFVMLNAYEVSHVQKRARTNIPYTYNCESTGTCNSRTCKHAGVTYARETHRGLQGSGQKTLAQH